MQYKKSTALLDLFPSDCLPSPDCDSLSTRTKNIISDRFHVDIIFLKNHQIYMIIARIVKHSILNRICKYYLLTKIMIFYNNKMIIDSAVNRYTEKYGIFVVVITVSLVLLIALYYFIKSKYWCKILNGFRKKYLSKTAEAVEVWDIWSKHGPRDKFSSKFLAKQCQD